LLNNLYWIVGENRQLKLTEIFFR